MLIVGRNWDRFGGRCHEILNAFLISKIFNIEFAFIWPSIEIFPEVDEQLNFFSSNFINRYKVDALLEEPVPLIIEGNLTKSQLQEKLNELQGGSIYLPNFFEVPKLVDVDTYRLFSELRQEVWSADLINVGNRLNSIMKDFGISGTVHCRFGDILYGDFCQYPDVNKYVPFPAIVKFLKNESQKMWVVISDSPEIVSVTSALCPNVVTRNHILDQIGQPPFSDDQLDLILLQESRQVVGPATSAFSKLGSHLSGQEPTDLVGSISEDEWEGILEYAVDRQSYGLFSPSIGAALQSRDISWLLDFRTNFIDIDVFNSAAEFACRVDANNVIARSQRAFGLAIKKDFRLAKSILSEGTPEANRVTNIHRDPIFYLLTIRTVVLMLEILQFFATRKLFKTRSNLKRLIQEVEEILEFLKSLDPYQLPKDIVLDNLVSAWLEIKSKNFPQGKFQRHRAIKDFLNLRSKLFIQSNISGSVLEIIAKEKNYQHFLVRVSSALRIFVVQAVK